MEIFKLVGSIMIDSAEAEKSISKTGEEAKSMGEKLGDGVKKAGKWAAGITAGAISVGAAMVAAAKDTASNMDVIDKASIRMGISAERYQELSYAAGLCGVEMSTMEKAAKKLEGTDLNFDDAINQLMAISDESERSAAATDLFGESVAYKLTPLLQAGAGGLAEMTAEANALGLVMGEDTVKAGAAMNDQFSKVEQSVNVLKTNLMTSLMPYVSQILYWVITNMPKIQATISRVIDAITPIVKPLLDMLMAFLPEFLSLFEQVMAFIQPPLEWLIGVISTALDGIFTLIRNAGSFLGNLFGIGGGSDNSHAGGLASVPYDGYKATLHRGETVLNANDASDLVAVLNDLKNRSAAQPQPATIVVQSVLDGKVVGETVTKYQKERDRAYGI